MSGALAIGSDHAGFSLKEALKQFLDQREIPYQDLGTYSTDSCDYPDIAVAVAKTLQNGTSLQGILCCGSGLGVAISANRLPGIRAIVAHDNHTAMMGRRHNDANIICFGGRVIAPEYAQEVLENLYEYPL